MQGNIRAKLLMLILTASVFSAAIGSGATPPAAPDKTPSGDQAARDDAAASPATVEEARGRAKLLHETIHATLQIVHLQYYRQDEGLSIPAKTLKSVFNELARRQKVQVHWLVVNAKAMNIDHNPRDEFEQNAAKAISSGESEVESFDSGVYRYAGAITLSSQCLGCHMPNRTSTKDRAAAVVISMPVKRG